MTDKTYRLDASYRFSCKEVTILDPVDYAEIVIGDVEYAQFRRAFERLRTEAADGIPPEQVVARIKMLINQARRN